eukprot:COSAG01_NODE_36462_length_517_cov_1.373206_1_plen_74_part_00
MLHVYVIERFGRSGLFKITNSPHSLNMEHAEKQEAADMAKKQEERDKAIREESIEERHNAIFDFEAKRKGGNS